MLTHPLTVAELPMLGSTEASKCSGEALSSCSLFTICLFADFLNSLSVCFGTSSPLNRFIFLSDLSCLLQYEIALTQFYLNSSFVLLYWKMFFNEHAEVTKVKQVTNVQQISKSRLKAHSSNVL